LGRERRKRLLNAKALVSAKQPNLRVTDSESNNKTQLIFPQSFKKQDTVMVRNVQQALLCSVKMAEWSPATSTVSG
jgi:hypothetical protein